MAERLSPYGGRKFILGLAYLLFSFVLGLLGVIYGRDLVGISALIASMSTGLGVIVWGNVQAGKGASNGSPR